MSDAVAAVAVTLFLLACLACYSRACSVASAATLNLVGSTQEEPMTIETVTPGEEPMIETIAITPGDDRLVQGQYVRIELRGGCGLDSCNCSPEPFIIISDGTTALSVTLTADQVADLLAKRSLVMQ